MTGNEKEVYFDKYCGSCVHVFELDKDGFLIRYCEECLSSPSNIDSHKPIKYKEKEKW